MSVLHTACEAALDALAILVPVACAGCGAADRAVCPACRVALAPLPVRRRTGDPPLGVVSGLRYEDEARSVILSFKEHGRTDAARPLAVALSAALHLALADELGGAAEGEVELVPVPSSRAAQRRRGFDPVSLILRRAGLPRPARVLVPTRRRAPQKTLDIESRAANLAGSLRARHPLDGRRFVIVDDVLTTGATLAEAARAIREAGGDPVGAVTVADTPRRSEGAFDDSPVKGGPARSPP